MSYKYEDYQCQFLFPKTEGVYQLNQPIFIKISFFMRYIGFLLERKLT